MKSWKARLFEYFDLLNAAYFRGSEIHSDVEIVTQKFGQSLITVNALNYATAAHA